MLVKDKKFLKTCPVCKKVIEILYCQYMNIKKGKSDGTCKTCIEKVKSKKTRLRKKEINTITCPECKKDREVSYEYCQILIKNGNDKLCRNCASEKNFSEGKTVIGKKGKDHHMFGKKLSKATKDKIANTLSPQRIGDKNPAWKGGKIYIGKTIRNMLEYKEWRFNIFKRDGFKCFKCDQVGGILNAHHINSLKKIIKKYSINNIIQAKGCDELWDEDNGVTICKKCHKLLHKKDGGK